MQVLIPAGGRGARLGPLTLKQPKPLLPIGEESILSRIVGGIPADVSITVLITAGLEPAFRAWLQGLPDKSRVSIYVEPAHSSAPRGPVNAIAEYLRTVDVVDDLVIMMGDSLLPFELGEFMASVTRGVLRLAAYGLDDIRDAGRFGVIETRPDGSVSHFEEKPQCPRSSQVFTGCFYLPARLSALLVKPLGVQLPQMGDFIAHCIDLGERVETFEADGAWFDIGTFESYLAAHQALLSDRAHQRLAALGNSLDGTVYVHPSAVVKRSHLSNCIVWADATVTDARLSECVVQSGALVEGCAVSGALVEAGGQDPMPLLGRLSEKCVF